MDQIWSFIVEFFRLIPMKQMTLLVAMVLGCGIGSLYNPFWGIFLYYSFAVLRPQYLWDWALPVELRWSLIAGIVIMLGVLTNLPKIALKGKNNTIIWLTIAYAVTVILSCLTADNPVLAQYWAIEYGKIFIVAVLAAIIINQLWQVKLLMAMILIMIGYIAWEVNFAYFMYGRLDIFHYGYCGFDNNGAALMLALALPFAYGFFNIQKSPILKFAAFTLAMLIMHAILMSYSRGAFVAILAGVIWLLIHHRPRYQGGLLILVLIGSFMVMAGPEIRDRLTSTADFRNDDSAQQRFTTWGAAWKIAWEDPVTGKGVRNSSMYIDKYGGKTNQAIHNQYLQIAADSGIPAMILYIAAQVVAFLRYGYARNACLNYLMDHHQKGCKEPPDKNLEVMPVLLLSAQASLLIFAAGGMFLSMEVFELPWLLIIIGGLIPDIITERINANQPGAIPLPRLEQIARKNRFKKRLATTTRKGLPQV